MTIPPEIQAFWQDFVAEEEALAAMPSQDRMERSNEILEQHLQGLALEVSASPTDSSADLIVTAHGKLENFPLLMRFVAAAPALNHHVLRAFRERAEDPDFAMGMEGFDLSTSDALVACEAHDGGIALEVRFAREIPQDFQDHAAHMVFIMLDHVLGEYDAAVKVSAVDFVDEAEDPDVPWTPLSTLAPVFDAFWQEELGRTGIFPSGEPSWAVLEWNPDADEEIDGDASGESGNPLLVMVNCEANAVAMRADLVNALTIDLPATDQASLAAARELQEQAATLLELAQTGLVAWTALQSGRRKALYYVSDAELARQTLAPLLSRIKDDPEGELQSEFDPNWSRYFEYAVHCR